MNFGKILGALVLALAMAQSAFAADAFSGHRGVCMWHQHNQIMNQPADVISQTVNFNYENARAALQDERVLGSSRPAFVWALEANNACANAVGYIKGGSMNAEAIQKCDCFHARMQTYR